MKKLLLILLVISGGLVVTNPGMESFTTFLEDYTETRIKEKTGDGVLGGALAGAGGAITAQSAPAMTERSNYVVASVYAVDPDGDDVAEWRFLGIGRQFIALRAPDG